MDATLATITRLVVPALADWSMLDLVEADGAIRRAAVAHADPGRAELAERLRRYPPVADAVHPVAKALRTGRPELVADTIPTAAPPAGATWGAAFGAAAGDRTGRWTGNRQPHSAHRAIRSWPLSHAVGKS